MNLYKFQNTIFNICIITTYFLLALFISGYKDAKIYLENINYYIKIYISVFLIYRFNPFKQIKFNELDRKIVYSAGLMLFATTAINQFIISIFSKL
jgi:hypothetical protein